MDNNENMPVPAETTAEAIRTPRPRKPKAEMRSLEELYTLHPKKMTDDEKNLVIEAMQCDNRNLQNKNQELDVSYRKLHEAAKSQDENFRRFVAERNAKMQYATDIMRMAYQSIKMANEGQ